MSDEADDLIDREEASRLLEVEPGQVDNMVDEGLLTPAGDGPRRRYRRAEILALRELGG